MSYRGPSFLVGETWRRARLAGTLRDEKRGSVMGHLSWKRFCGEGLRGGSFTGDPEDFMGGSG
jgi:hypothetical protein